MQPEKTLKKLTVEDWRMAQCLRVLRGAARARDPQNFDQSPPCWMPKIFDEWSILPKQVDSFFGDA